MKKEKVYSAILQDFIEPIVVREETEDSYFEKCLMGHIIWNYCVCLEYKLPVTEDVFEVLKEKYLSRPETKRTVELLMERWKQSFKQYDRFIFKIETIDRNGETTLRVESMPAEIMKRDNRKGLQLIPLQPESINEKENRKQDRRTNEK